MSGKTTIAQYILIVGISLIAPVALAQTFRVNLSPKHEQKLGMVKSGHKRMQKYYKYYKKDSLQYVHKKDRALKKEWDSIDRSEQRKERINRTLTKRGIRGEKQVAYADSLQKRVNDLSKILNSSSSGDSAKRAAKKALKEITKDKLDAELATKGHPLASEYKMKDSLRNELRKWSKVLKDTTASDSLRSIARDRVKTLFLTQIAGDENFKALYKQCKLRGEFPDWNSIEKQVPGADTLQGIFDSSPEKLMLAAEEIAEQSVIKSGDLASFSRYSAELNQMKGMMKSVTGTDSIQSSGKSFLKKKAIDHFEGQEPRLQAAQKKVTGALGKYREFINANGETTGIKQSSLKGKAFKERIVLGGNFNIVSTDPVSVDMSPIAGYRFNTHFFAGVGLNYRHTFSDSLKFKWYVSPQNMSLRLFVSHDVFKSFFAHGETEFARMNLKSNESVTKAWVKNYYLGLGKKLLIHPKLYLTITGLYNLNGQKFNPSHPNRFQVRIGFQTSDLTFRKKNLNYRH